MSAVAQRRACDTEQWPNLAPLPIARLGLLHTLGNVPEAIVYARHNTTHTRTQIQRPLLE